MEFFKVQIPDPTCSKGVDFDRPRERQKLNYYKSKNFLQQLVPSAKIILKMKITKHLFSCKGKKNLNANMIRDLFTNQ